MYVEVKAHAHTVSQENKFIFRKTEVPSFMVKGKLFLH